MDVTNVPSADREETDHPVQVGSPLISDGVESAFNGVSVNAAEVTFRPGERTRFHAHAGVQILYVTKGIGVVGNREEEHEVSEGDIVVFEPGEEHWHGTGEDADSEFSHVYFLAEPDEGELEIQEAP
ncbi:cupin domain-containing protein [Halobaculum sp. EA56]|uniref:cupin domain-containing protein n=1 Tax=Halobaculum sp. EA56 TaxID=3421648 RepID=UPI003EBB4246